LRNRNAKAKMLLALFFYAKFMEILKTSDKHNTILFVALEPDEVDRNGDKISTDEIHKTAYEFMQNLSVKKVNVNHLDDTDINDAKFVESYILNETRWEVKKWSWIVWIKFPEKIYKQFMDGEFVWISIEWEAVREFNN